MADKLDDLAGTQRAAILLMSLGEQDAANLLKQLDAREVQKLGIAMAELKEVSREQMSSVLDKFIGIADSRANIAGGSPDFVRRVLTQAVGKHKTDMLLDRVTTGQAGQGIESLKWMEAKAVAQIISGEHPQIAAIVLSHLEPEQAAAILPLLTEDMRTEILMRIATLNEVPQSALTELDQLVEKQANATPPAIGPSMRATLNWMDCRAMAFERSSLSTSMGTSSKVNPFVSIGSLKYTFTVPGKI